MGYCIFGLLQFALQLLETKENTLFLVVNLNKINFLSLAIYFQTYEWFNAWLLVRF
jgi:hypothetical protein